MTTIAYKDGIIAYDSQQTAGDIIIDDDCNKRTVVDGVSFFATGIYSDETQLIDLYFGKSKNFDIECSALVCDKGKIYQINIDNDRLHKFEIDMEKPYAIGSGRDHAFTAMDLGCSAKEAVKMAIKRDWGSGGKVRTFKI